MQSGDVSLETRLSSEESLQVANVGSLDSRISALDSEQDADQASIDNRISLVDSVMQSGDVSLETRLSEEESTQIVNVTSLNSRVSALDDADQASIDARLSTLDLDVTRDNKIAVQSVNKTFGLAEAESHFVAGADGLTFTLPAAPTGDMFFAFKNYSGVNATLTISGNGNDIDGQSSIVIDVPNVSVKVMYDSASGEWYLF
jgi:uncharacterized small protein (DUF1192 family)